MVNSSRRNKAGAAPGYTPRAQATRGRVLQVTRECLAEVGASNISTNEIARRAGVSWGVIQYHFGTRDGLLVALVEEGFSSLRARLEKLDPANLTLEERLAAVADAAWGYYSQPEYLLSGDVVRALRGSGESRARLNKVLRSSEAEVARLWDELIKPCLPTDGPASDAVRTLVFASIRGLAISRSLRKGAFVDERKLLVRALSELLVAE